MNIFDNIKRRISNTWREQSTTEVIDLSDDSESEVSQQSKNSTHRSSSSPTESSGSFDSSSKSSFRSASSRTSASTSTPKYSGHRQPTLADAMQKFNTLPKTPELDSSPDLQVVNAAPKFKPSPPVIPLVPIGMNVARQSRSPVYSQKEQDAAKQRATLTEKIFAKKEQLKKLERFQSNEGFISSLPDKGVKIENQIAGLRCELRILYKSLKELGEIPPLKEVKKENNLPAGADADKLTPFEQLPVKKNYQRPGDHAVAEALTGDALIQLHSSLRDFPENAMDNGPKHLEVELLLHQKKALAWALWRECKHPQGGILADDMGLGKTLTMIALILRSKELRKDNEENVLASPRGMKKAKTLVVCPASVLKQWESEIIHRCEPRSLVPFVYHGNSRNISINRLCRADVVITSYAIVGREGKVTKDYIPGQEERPAGMLFQVRWERVILDEAHTIRNPKTMLAQGVVQLDSKYRWCLTGTPLHNKLRDIYSLFNFLKFTPFTNELVWRRVAENKTAQGLERLNTVMKSVMLRRTKVELQQAGQLDCLPNKGVQEITLELSDEEQKIYQYMLKKSKTLMAKFILQRAEKQVDTGEDIYAVRKAMEQLEKDGFTVKKGMHRDGDQVQASHILVLLLRLRQICCHMSLVKNKLEVEQMAEENIESPEKSFDDLVDEINNLSIMEPADKKEESILDPENPIFETEFTSTKVLATVKLVSEIMERGEKVVVVSQWKSFLGIIQEHLKLARIRCTLFTGDLNTAKRQEIITEFNEEKGKIKVLLLSLTAGGTGVNLIGGNNLVLIDIHWNPQLEAQAMDRIYRVGQKRDVNIFKMICHQSIESSIQMMQEKKLALAEGVLNKNQAVKLNMEDLRLLFMNA